MSLFEDAENYQGNNRNVLLLQRTPSAASSISRMSYPMA
jgi:hypothetical protein